VWRRRFFTFEDAPEDVPTPGKTAEPAETEEEEPEGEPVRLRFSPAFLALASALVLIPVIKGWAPLFFLVPFIAFTFLSRKDGESAGQTASRFFQANDQAEPEAEPVVPPPPAEPTETVALLPGR
jgi:hypothetical protein